MLEELFNNKRQSFSLVYNVLRKFKFRSCSLKEKKIKSNNLIKPHHMTG